MTDQAAHYTAFAGEQRLTTGDLARVALTVKARLAAGERRPVLIFDDGTGDQIDLDLRGSDADVLARLPTADGADPGAKTASAAGKTDSAPAGVQSARRTGPGRPRLGVVAREVTLLPRHWEWLGSQPGGASAALRRLVEAARRDSREADRARRAQEAVYKVMRALAGDRPGFEEATRSLFAPDLARFAERISGWPPDVRDHLLKLSRPLIERATGAPHVES